MRRETLYAVAIFCLVLAGGIARATDAPLSRIDNVCEIIHEIEVCDPYRWLEEVNATEVKQWVDVQNRYTEPLLHSIFQRGAIRLRLRELYQSRSRSLPYVYGNRYFFTESGGEQEQRILYVQERKDGVPRVLIDPNTLSKEAGRTISLGGWKPSRDGKLLAYGLSETAGDARSLHVLGVDFGQNLSDVIPSSVFPYISEWVPDGSGFYYTRRPVYVPSGEEKYHQKVYLHKIGTQWQDDPLVCCDGFTKETWPRTGISDDGRWLLVHDSITSVASRKIEIFLKDLSDSTADLIPVVRGVNAKFHSIIHGQYLYILTDHAAPLWKIMRVRIEDISKGMDVWQTIIPEGAHTIQRMRILGEHLFVETLESISSRLASYTLEGKYLRTIPLPVVGSLAGFSYQPGSREFFFGFSSFFFPHTVYRYDLESGKYAKLWGDEVAGVDPAIDHNKVLPRLGDHFLDFP